MTDDQSAPELSGHNVFRLKAVAEVEPGALTRVLQLFDERSVVPRRVNAQRVHLRGTGRDVLHIEIEITALDVTMDALRFIAARIAQMPNALSTVFGGGSAE